MRLALGFLGLLAVACGSVPSDGTDGGDEADAVGLDGTSIGIDASGLDGGALVGPVATQPVHHLQPLELGWHWTWQVNYDPGMIALGSECADGEFVQDTIGFAVGPGGKVGTEIDVFCGEPGQKQIYTYLDGGVDYANAGLWVPYLRAPLEQGAAWSNSDGYTSVWEGPNPIGVAAGNFDACWTAVVTDSVSGYITRQVYCPDVGLVYIELTDTSFNPIVTAQITAYTRDP